MSGEQERGRVNRLKEWYRSLKEPKHVEKASRRERLKRQIWMLASTMVCLGSALIVNGVLIELVGASWPIVAVGVIAVVAAFYVDVKYVFPWGFDRFDLVAPWQFRDAEEANNEGNQTMSDGEYDGPRLGEMIKFSVLFGPEGGMGAWPCDEGTLYISPKSAYQYRNGEWVDLEADTEEVFRAVAMYVDPEEMRRRQQQW